MNYSLIGVPDSARTRTLIALTAEEIELATWAMCECANREENLAGIPIRGRIAALRRLADALEKKTE